MVLKVLLLAFLFVLIAGFSYGQSQVPPLARGVQSDSPKPQATNKDTNPTSNQSGSGTASLVTKAHDPEHAKDQPSSIPKESNQQRTTEWWPTAEGWLAIFTLGLFIATAILACATFRLVRGAEDTAKKELRAYVGVARVHIVDGNGTRIPRRGIFIIKNFGKTML
jgi:hypothetical protein